MLFFASSLDVGNLDDVKSAFETVKGHVGDKGLNVLINNAGILNLEGRLQDVTPEIMMESYKINAIAPTMIIKVRHFIQKVMNCKLLLQINADSPFSDWLI